MPQGDDLVHTMLRDAWTRLDHRVRHRLRTKTVVALSAILLLLSLTMAYLGHALLRRSAQDMDQKAMEDMVVHFQRGVLGGTASYLSHKVGDWSIWDPTVSFVHNRNPDYITFNLTPQLFIESHVELVAFFDRRGQVVHARSFDVDRGADRTLPAQLKTLFDQTALQPLLEGSRETLSGLVTMDQQLWLVALRPIRSPGTPAIHGAMLMGHLLDEPGMNYMARTWDQPFTLQRLDPATSPPIPETRLLAPGLACGKGLPSGQGLVIHCVVDDLFGRPAARLTAMRTGLSGSLVHRARNLYLVGLAICMVLFALCTTWLLYRLIFGRLERLQGDLVKLGTARDLSSRLEITGHDELSMLATTINTMLGELGHARQIEARERQLDRLFHKTFVAKCIVEGETIVLCNQSFADLFGARHPEELIGKPIRSLFFDPGFIDAYRASGLQQGGELEVDELTFTRADGRQRTVRARLFRNTDPLQPDRVVSVEGFFLDITAQEEQRRYYRQLFDLATEAITVFDFTGRVYDMNLKTCELLGLDRETVLREGFDWRACVDPDDLKQIESSLAKLYDGGNDTARLEITLLHRDGPRWPVLASYRRLERRFDWASDRLLVVMTDIRALKALEAELRSMSFQDGLTGLYNKRFLEQAMRMACERRDGMVGLIVVDVNYLKLVNDTLGHAAGDTLLQRTANLLKATCRSADLCARTGGDEFCVLLQQATREEVDRVMQRLKEGMLQERQKGEGIPFSLAMGAAWLQTPCEPQALLEQADQAMYLDKASQKRQDRAAGFIAFDPRAGSIKNPTGFDNSSTG